jgi:hypothetical protein
VSEKHPTSSTWKSLDIYLEVNPDRGTSGTVVAQVYLDEDTGRWRWCLPPHRGSHKHYTGWSSRARQEHYGVAGDFPTIEVALADLRAYVDGEENA